MLDMAELASAPAGRPSTPRSWSTSAAAPSPPTWPARSRALRERGFSPRVLFLDAADEVLVRRFESVRRPHPLQGSGRLLDGIAAERELLAEARETPTWSSTPATSTCTSCAARVEELFGGEDSRRLRVTVLSFGFKYGLPLDADFVVDVRFLPNPYWVPELRDHTGRDGGGEPTTCSGSAARARSWRPSCGW